MQVNMCILPIKKLRPKQVNGLVQGYSQVLPPVLCHSPLDLQLAITSDQSAIQDSCLHFIHFRPMGATRNHE